VSGAHGGQGEDAYASAGVDYAVLDAGKRLAIDSALATSSLLAARGGRALDDSRGEPAFVFEFAGLTLALVLEGLGTKSVLARLVAERQGVNHFRAVAVDAVAAIVNDLCCVGARPLVLNAYFATGAPEWFAHEDWHAELIAGWAAACKDAGCVWGGGESPTLPGLVAAEDIELAGSAVGSLPAGRAPVLGQDLAPGDEVVLVASSGLHANGSSLARMVARALPEGFATVLPGGGGSADGGGLAGGGDPAGGRGPAGAGGLAGGADSEGAGRPPGAGRPADASDPSDAGRGAQGGGLTFGEALLAPSLIYSPLVEAVLDAGLPVSYLSHVTGHGFLKLMRPPRALTYRITELLPVPEVLAFLAARAGMSARTAYSTLNMGCGFAVYCGAGAGAAVVDIAARLGFDAIVGGYVEEGPRRVLLDPLGIEFAGEELRLGPEGGSGRSA
jgi:phosphoribosylformylglycinamidine cyclo-ligase